MAGHSKFKNIQHRKGAQDKRRAKQFARLARELMIAARQGEDQASNPRLRTAIQNARAANMPKDNIQRAISKSRDSDAAAVEEIRYEGFAPGGVGLMIEAVSDNRNRAASGIRSTLTKFGGNLGEHNVVAFMFKPMGELFYAEPSLTQDQAWELAMAMEVSDYYPTPDGHFFFCDHEAMETIAENLEKSLGEAALSQRRAWLATTRIAIDETASAQLDKIIESLEELDDVRYVFSNAEADGKPLLYAPV